MEVRALRVMDLVLCPGCLEKGVAAIQRPCQWCGEEATMLNDAICFKCDSTSCHYRPHPGSPRAPLPAQFLLSPCPPATGSKVPTLLTIPTGPPWSRQIQVPLFHPRPSFPDSLRP